MMASFRTILNKEFESSVWSWTLQLGLIKSKLLADLLGWGLTSKFLFWNVVSNPGFWVWSGVASWRESKLGCWSVFICLSYIWTTSMCWNRNPCEAVVMILNTWTTITRFYHTESTSRVYAVTVHTTYRQIYIRWRMLVLHKN